MKRSIRFLLVVTLAGLLVKMLTDWPLIVIMLGAFTASCIRETWRNYQFHRELAQMSAEVKERGNVQ